jgi:gamma-glutamylputrescine oxidase
VDRGGEEGRARPAVIPVPPHRAPGSPGAHVRSYWAATSRETAEFPALDRDLEADVAIVGAGFTGLSAAYHLARLGKRCVLLEAERVGWGASGRNGGQAVPRYKPTFPELERRYGLETALALYRLAQGGVDTLERIIADECLPCGFKRHGHVTPIQNAPDVARFAADAEWLVRHANDDRPRMLDAAEVARRTGSAIYRAGYLEPRGAGFHPVEYCESLAKALAARGVLVHCHTPVERWSADGAGVLLETAAGPRVRASHLVLATNGYTDTRAAGDALKRRVVPIVSSQIATAPLSPALLAGLLPDGNTATDAKRLTHYYRVMPDGRFMFGGRAGATHRESAAIFARLERELGEVFPQLRGAAVEFRWSGRVAVTTDSLPHIGRLGERVFYGMGYNGRGVALSALFGAMLSRLVAGDAIDLGPMSHGRFDPIPFHALQVPAKAVAITYKRILDAVGA